MVYILLGIRFVFIIPVTFQQSSCVFRLRDRFALLLFIRGRVFRFNICLLVEKAPFWTDGLFIQVLIGIIVNITRAWDRSIRVRNALAMGMLSACLNGTVVGYLLSRGKSEITGIKVRPFLLLVSWKTALNFIKSTLKCLPSKYPCGRFSYVLKSSLSLSESR